MAKTLDDLERLLTGRGYPCRRVNDSCVVTQLPTRAYTNRAGAKAIDVQLAFDRQNGCLTMDTPWAFDSKQATHKEAMLACLLAASGRSPLVKTQLDPKDGEVRLRVDCRLGADGVKSDDVLTMLSLIPAFADRWYPHIKNAMDKGLFDADGPPRSESDERLESIARRCGGINRLESLLRMRREGRSGPRGTDPSAN
ncbi:MAG: hypothetical protein ACKO4T_15340 [Planctomycetaceae bacterium]